MNWAAFLNQMGDEYGLTTTEKKVLVVWLPDINQAPLGLDESAQQRGVTDKTTKKQRREICGKFQSPKSKNGIEPEKCTRLANMRDGARKGIVLRDWLLEQYKKRHPREYARQNSGVNPKDREISELLMKLECHPYSHEFSALLSKLSPAGVFLVRAKDQKEQTWLINRLASKIPGFTDAKKLSIDIRKARINTNFQRLWQCLGDGQTESNRDEIVNGFCREAKSKCVILAFYCLSSLQESTIKADKTNFWSFLTDLIEQMKRAEPQPSSRKGIYIFLTHDDIVSEAPDIFPTQSVQSTLLSSRLKPLTPLSVIDTDEIKWWIENEDPIYIEHLPRYCQSKGISQENFLGQAIKEWGIVPWTVLNESCVFLGQEKGIEAIEPFWNWEQQ